MRTAESQVPQTPSAGWGWRLATSLAVAATLVLTPTVAQAAFTGPAQDVLTASTLTLAAPAQLAGGIKCSRSSPWPRATVELSVAAGVVPRASTYSLTVTSPANQTTTVPLDGNRRTVYSLTGSSASLSGKWKYRLRADYKVPGGPTWFGVPLEGSYFVTC